ncbi:enoyl-[acyl-carrier-protein] reductase FabV [Alginatibacterium sediminis]|uniref:trans-2-enoyl-CoA reductase (NAD(+)) n=1 Tax=Alginatibacterium sediminis TaxID=2164068 RepID=A0A420ENJ5_9ALTE|nr:enoyl-[acyl-carrier-protein] reductase FabV [Alginatibacterium sediminis]RKF22164.1 enoyl-[acyl-carrier-protein] reductase FabV [Alginatibacterium sediminis]
MSISPLLSGNVARNCHPVGCQAYVQQQVDYINSLPKLQTIKNVLIIGGSSGFGLASRVALTQSCHSNSLSVSMERGPSEKGMGSAGWYNNVFAKQQAEALGLRSDNIIADAFSLETMQSTVDYFKANYAGKIDLVIYSLASGKRIDGEQTWFSCLKTAEQTMHGYSLNLETDSLTPDQVGPASQDELEATAKVMGGEPWLQWIEVLANADLLNSGCKTLAFSYIGPELTAPIYRDGSIGFAKQNLHLHAGLINTKFRDLSIQAMPCVAKALVTKASVFIPVMSPYIAALYDVMKHKELHEETIQQAYRLLSEHLFPKSGEAQLDDEGCLRIDDWELREDVQAQVNKQLDGLSPENFKQRLDYQGYKQSFLQLNGFGFEHIDYSSELDSQWLAQLRP